MRIEECDHPPGVVFLTDAGLTVQCGACGVRRRVSRQQIQVLMAPKAGERDLPPDPKPQDKFYGPSSADIALIARRLDFALRAMGKAFFRGDHTPKQEYAIELAVDACNGFKEIEPGTQKWLDAVVARFPDAEPLWESEAK